MIRGQTEDEVLQSRAQHAKEQHGMATLPPDVTAKVKASIRDE